jgi:hypothetical protein
MCFTRAQSLPPVRQGLELPTQSADDPWWDTGPHVEKDGRLFYVHAMGCLQAQLGQAVVEHPDWYFVAVLPQADAEYGVMLMSAVSRGSSALSRTLEQVLTRSRRTSGVSRSSSRIGRSALRGACPGSDRRFLALPAQATLRRQTHRK